MPEIAKKAAKADPGPEASPDCPRCHYFAKREVVIDDRMNIDPYPPLDQRKVDEILRIAFPPRR